MRGYQTLAEALAEANRHGAVGIMVDTKAIRIGISRVAALEAALRALLATEPRYLQHISTDDMYVDACAYCTGIMDEGNRVFLHEITCPWLTAKALVGIA